MPRTGTHLITMSMSVAMHEKTKTASSKPSSLCDPLVPDRAQCFNPKTLDAIMPDPSHSSKIAGDQLDDSKQGVAQYSNLRMPTD